ncbi:MAG: choline dehydrogenase [Streptosporangiaceae bacterium]|nr:choline dehydrogenase [Streptosporangiaceae bacterium]
MASRGYDVVIAGGGSAGSALANRLSADPGTRVLVLEAGRPDYVWDPYIHMPAALTFPIGNRFYDWKYESEPEPHLGGRRIYHARGKVLGGSSSINGMIFQRGNPLDYERWAADPGMAAWDYAHCLPYFKRMENCLAAADGDPWRGVSGPLVLERGPASSPLFGAFFAAVRQAGYSLTGDVNGYRQEGFAAFDRNIHRGRRLSAARAYLWPVMNRPNLTVASRALVTKIIFRGTQAVGVEFTHQRTVKRVRAGEVIVCGGAINTPQLLQLSGIGNAADLAGLGIDVVADLPGVGENLQDHLEVYVQYGSKQPVSVAPALKWRNRPLVAAKWLLARSGPGATNHFEGGGFACSNDEVAYPNLMFHFLPIAIRYDGSAPAGGHGYQVHVGPMCSDSRGTCKITSADPAAHPALRFNYLSTPTDRREWPEAIRIARTILNQPAFDDYSAGELSPGEQVQTDEQILAWVARDAETALHPSCTAKMGTGAASVVDPGSMRVHGTSGLRIADASVMPYITNGNIYAPVMMIAEKAADLIAGNTPLPPEPLEFYRRDRRDRQAAPSEEPPPVQVNEQFLCRTLDGGWPPEPATAPQRGILYQELDRTDERHDDRTAGTARSNSAMTTPNDPLPEALGLVQGAADAGHQLKILGGLGVRVLCPDFPPRQRSGQDIDFACLGKRRRQVAEALERLGCEPDRRFNNLNGDRQMYFTAPSGRPVDVIVDRLTMCHTLDLRPSFASPSPTLDPADLLLSKLQIVEINAKDAHDIVHLLSGVRVGRDGSHGSGGARPFIDPDRFGAVLAADWGWWRTVTGNLAKLPGLAAEHTPAAARFDPLIQAKQLLEVAETVPKGLKWKLRANVGDRVRWYELPEEVEH